MKNASKTEKEIRDWWRTPRPIVNYYDRKHRFVMDVAASDENHLFPSYFTEKLNALALPWPPGAVWCNPPYSNITPWVDKAVQESTTGTSTVFLVNSDNSVQWFARMWQYASEIDLISGRVGFIRHDTGKKTNGNMRPQMVAVIPAYLQNRKVWNGPIVNLISREALK